MDRTPLTEALRTAKSVVMSHGIINYMNETSKKYQLDYLIDPNSDSINFDFSIHPKKSVWDTSNSSCTLKFSYRMINGDEEIFGALCRNYCRRITVSYGSSEISLKGFRERENLISSLMLLCEMLEAITPEKVQITVMTQEAVAEKKKRTFEQVAAARIFYSVDCSVMKNLRKGGNGKLTKLPESYLQEHGSFPETGDYRFNRVTRYDRRGRVKEAHDYILKVSTRQDSCYVRFIKVS